MSSVVNISILDKDLTVTVTCHPSVVAAQLQALKSSVVHPAKLVVGLGVEWYSADANAKPALLQLCIRTRFLVIQLPHMFLIPPELKDFLADSKITFVGGGIQTAVAKLKDGYGLACANAVELATLAPAKRSTDASAERDVVQLLFDVCGVCINKPKRLPCFYSPSSVLTHNEIVNAAKDAYAAYIVGVKLLQACECKIPYLQAQLISNFT